MVLGFSLIALSFQPYLGGQAQVLENLPFQADGHWSLNLASIPDALPQGRLRFDDHNGLYDPLNPGGPCLVEPTGVRTGLPLDWYYQAARLGYNLATDDLTIQGGSLQSPCSQEPSPGPGNGTTADLGNFLNAVATVGLGSDDQNHSMGDVELVPDSLQWIVAGCALAGTQFEPNGGTTTPPMSRGMLNCALTSNPLDLTSYFSPNVGTGFAGTQFEQPRLGDLFPPGSGSSWVVSCLRAAALEYLPDGGVVEHPGLVTHDWFLLVDRASPLNPAVVAAGLDTNNWYDLSGDNGCPIPFPAIEPPPGLPLTCAQSTLQVVGVASTSPNADYDGAVELRFRLGANRALVGEHLSAPTVAVQTHDDQPNANLHTWRLHALDAGIHDVTYTVRTHCRWPNFGQNETISVQLRIREPGNRCVSQGNSVDGAVIRFVVGFDQLPADVTVGSTYNTGLVVFTDDVLEFAAVEVNVATTNSFTQNTTDDQRVRYCEIDGTAQMDFTPNDASWGSQYGPTQIRAPQAWDTTLGTTAKTVCIVDTGVRYTHQDLTGSRWLGGYDFVNSDSDPWDDQGHGTHVAGIAAATTHNSLGIAGIAQVGIKAAKVLSSSGSGTWSWVASGIRWCADNGGDVINLSLGGSSPSTAVESAVNHAWSTRGKVVVASAGNSGPCTNCVGYPARYVNAIAVACTTSTEAQCSFSSEGPEVDLAAPGNGILSTCYGSNSQYCTKSGTSMSAPHVAGSAALIWSYVTSLTNTQVRGYLECKAKDLGSSGVDNKYGKGLVQLKESLDAAIAGTCNPCSATILVNGAAPTSSTYRGPVTVTVSHSGTTHPTSVRATASDGARIYVDPMGHDQWRVYAGDYGTRRITFTATLSCGTFTASWMQYN